MTVASEFDIAIVGMAGRFPGARSVEEFWANIAGGIESITRLSDAEIVAAGGPATALADPRYVKAAPVLDRPEYFDAGFFGYTPAEALAMDPQHRILLEVAQEALDDAGVDPGRTRGRIGVFAGSALNSYFLSAGLHRRLAADYIPTLIGNDKDFLSTRLSYKLDLRGPSITVQTACSTSLVAVHLACQSLLSGESDLALAGAVAVRAPHRVGYFCDGGGIVSADGHVRAFDAAANGTVFGSGAGIVVLRRLADALADGDAIRAVIKGSAINNDGSAKAGYTAPSVDSQADAVIEALANAGADAESISYLEAHGSGTPVGDPIEIRALTKAFRATTTRRGFCAVGSVKTNVGHLDAAAGIAGLIKTVLALEHRQLPPSLHFRTPNPELDLENSPFFVNTTLREWRGNGPRRAGVMSTGMGGTNAHVVLEEAPSAAARTATGGPHLLVLSAKTGPALDRTAARLADILEADESAPLDGVARTLQTGRQAFSCRRYLVCDNRARAVTALRAGDPRRQRVSSTSSHPRRPIVLLLPGLGDHYVGMGAGLYERWPVFRDAVDECARLLHPHLGTDIRTVLYPASRSWERSGGRGIDLRKMLGRGVDVPDDPEAAPLDRALFAQPALFAIEYATARLWESLGVVPDAIVGHSMGEYVAACRAGVLSLDDALRLIAERARMVESLPRGGMLAVTLSEAELLPLLPETLSISLINGPRLCVVAGPADDVSRFAKAMEAREIIVRRVKNTHAFHSRMLDPIVAPLEAVARSVALRPPTIPYISNVSGTWITPDEATDPAYWARHATRTARFSDALRELWRFENPILLEAGPGRTLSLLAMQHPARPRSVEPTLVACIRHSYENRPDAEFLTEATGQLWLAGVEIDWTSLSARTPQPKVRLPAYPFEGERYWLDPAPAAKPETAGTDVEHAGIRKNPNPSEWLYFPSWRRTLPPRVGYAAAAQHTNDTETQLVFADDSPFGAALVRALERAGHRVVVVRPGNGYRRLDAASYTVAASSAEDYDSLLRALRDDGLTPDAVVHAWTAEAPIGESETPDAFSREQARGFYSLLFLARSLAAHGSRSGVRVTVVSTHVQDVTGVDTLCPARATVLAPTLVIRQEYPHIRVTHVDLAASESGGASTADVQAVLDELAAPDPDPFVAYRNGRRWLRTYEPLLPASTGSRTDGFRREGVYLITGGLGEIGTSIAEYLAEQYAARLVLVGRAPVPADDEQAAWIAGHLPTDPVRRRIEAIRRIEQRGGKVLYVAADVGDAPRMRAAVSEAVRRFGRIDGVIHAAGIVGNHRDIDALEAGDCESHFQPKVRGTEVLAEVFRDQPPTFFLLMSSLASILGGIGRSAYAASNVFMDAFANQASRDGDVSWLSVDWDVWRVREDSVTSATAGATLRDLGMDRDEAMTMLETAVRMRDVGQLIVSTGQLDARMRQWLDLESVGTPSDSSPTPAPHATLSPRPALRNAFVAPRDDAERRVAQVWESALGIGEIGIDDNFADLGGHSLLAVKIVAELRRAFDVALPVRALFDAPTVAELTDVIKTRIIAEIDALSDEEAVQLTANE